jgi:hypothetical protein
MLVNNLRGKEVLALIPDIDKKVIKVKVTNLEANGIWVESDSIKVSLINESLGTPEGEKPVFFVPFSAITALVGWVPIAR